MKISQLSLSNFRNFKSLNLEFGDGLNVIIGKNGQGKTNIIESLVFLSLGRSFRTGNDQYLIRDKEDFAKIKSLFFDEDKKFDLEAVLSREGKYLRINQNVMKRLSDFMGLCNIVLFEPDDLNFFTQSPKLRRKNIDIEIGKISESYLYYLSQYIQILSERNAYLKENKLDQDYLDILTQRLVHASIPIYKARLAFIDDLRVKIRELYKTLSMSDIMVDLEYKSWITDLDEEDLVKKMQESLKRDKDFKMTHIGIHRDDFIFKMNQVPVINIASQGQKRLLMIAMKLALVEIIDEKKGKYPILCLDDLFSELDEQKRKLILSMIHENIQVFITTTDLNFIETNRPYKLYQVEEGICKEEL